MQEKFELKVSKGGDLTQVDPSNGKMQLATSTNVSSKWEEVSVISLPGDDWPVYSSNTGAWHLHRFT